MKKERVVFAGIAFVFIIFLIFGLDSEIIRGISFLRTSLINDFFIGIGFISSLAVIFILSTLLFVGKKRRKWVLPLWFAMLISVIISFILKVSVQRMRPYQMGLISILPGLESLAHTVWNFSFPSFQAMLIFSVAPFLSKEFPLIKYLWIIFAFIVALSRVYLGLHFLSDVVVGGLIGYLIGITVITSEKENKYCEKFYKKIFG